MLSFECIKNEKSVYFLLTSAAAGNVGLVVAQSFGSLGKALVLGNIVKNAVIIVGNSHFFCLRAISFRYVQHIKYTFYIFLLEQYNTGVLRRQVL